MSNKKEWIVDKLKRLVKLSTATEPDIPDDTYLFTPNTIDAYDLLNEVEKNYDHMTNSDIVKIMSEANKIWKIRKKIWNGEWDDLEHTIMMHEIEDLIRKNQKIAAIKEYRKVVDCTLREAKDFVDSIQASLVGKLKH